MRSAHSTDCTDCTDCTHRSSSASLIAKLGVGVSFVVLSAGCATAIDYPVGPAGDQDAGTHEGGGPSGPGVEGGVAPDPGRTSDPDAATPPSDPTDSGLPTDPGDGGAPTVPSTPKSGGAPATCADLPSAKGCCSADGATNYFCSKTAVKTLTCAAGTVCGWDATKAWYGCVAAPGSADPSGKYPMACGGSAPTPPPPASTCSTCQSKVLGTGGVCSSAAAACDAGCQSLIKCLNACAPSDTACSSACTKVASSSSITKLNAMTTCICKTGCTKDCATECGP